MKNPCTKDCPDRTVTCRTACEKFKEYRAWRDSLYEERQKAFIVDDFRIHNINRVNGRIRRKKKK